MFYFSTFILHWLTPIFSCPLTNIYKTCPYKKQSSNYDNNYDFGFYHFVCCVMFFMNEEIFMYNKIIHQNPIQINHLL